MPIDPSTIGSVSMALLDRLEEQYGDDAELMRVVTVVEVRYPHPDEEGKHRITVQWEHNDTLPATIGLLAVGLRGMIE